MKNLTVHTIDSAPEASKPTLNTVKRANGFLPNLYGVFAESPAITEAYATVSAIFEKTYLTPAEKQVILLTNSRLNHCTYCMAAHTTISEFQGVDASVIEALRRGTAIADPKLEALRVFSVRINENRGVVAQEDIDAFLAAGFSTANILDVILGTSLKTLSNYTNHIAETPLDEAFKANVWSPSDSIAELANTAHSTGA